MAILALLVVPILILENRTTPLSARRNFHPYELPPTREELSGWCDTLREVLEKTERA